MPALLLAAALALVAYGLITGRGIASRFVRLIQPESRHRVLLAWAGGTMLGWGVTSIVALALLGRLGAIVTMPDEMRDLARRLDLPAALSTADLLFLAQYLGLGAVIGLGIIAIGHRLGRKPLRFVYRSPLTARGTDEFGPASLLALAAGVGEELFFRLLLPLLVILVTGDSFAAGVAGLAVGWVAFVALHRHQGWLGLLSVALVGAAFTYLYLLSGALWLVIALHTIVDLSAFVIRPWLTGFQR